MHAILFFIVKQTQYFFVLIVFDDEARRRNTLKTKYTASRDTSKIVNYSFNII